jgi:hypothetical protein
MKAVLQESMSEKALHSNANYMLRVVEYLSTAVVEACRAGDHGNQAGNLHEHNSLP